MSVWDRSSRSSIVTGSGALLFFSLFLSSSREGSGGGEQDQRGRETSYECSRDSAEGGEAS